VLRVRENDRRSAIPRQLLHPQSAISHAPSYSDTILLSSIASFPHFAKSYTIFSNVQTPQVTTAPWGELLDVEGSATRQIAAHTISG
jgi:hypothetical protein